MKEFTVNRNDSGQRLDKYLLKSIPLLPSSLMHKYIRLKRIKLNGKRCQANTILNPGDVLTLYINDEFFEVSSHSYGFLSSPSDIDLSLIHIYNRINDHIRHLHAHKIRRHIRGINSNSAYKMYDKSATAAYQRT